MSFRREKLSPWGGPDGGNGGRGADVVLHADPRLATLMDLRYKRDHFGKNGQPGGGRDKSGADAPTLEIRVPVGTQVFDAETDALLADLLDPHQSLVIAKGGKGGKGNAHFATPSRRTPEYAQPGIAGHEHQLRLELKLLADVGLVGFPNAGKSTLISRISKARPKIADYPFTTLVPNLGVVQVSIDRSYVVADIPGLIEGAADGAGLGHQFLRHIERTEVLVYLITQDLDPERSPVGDFRALQHELARHDPTLLDRPTLVVLSQCDRTDVREQLDAVRAALPEFDVLPISAITGDGLKPLLNALSKRMVEAGRWPD